MTVNLEDYEDFLDMLIEHIDNPVDDVLGHFGIKGMRWGVRKTKSSKPGLQTLGPDLITRKTKAGDEVSLVKNPPTKLHEFLGRHSKTYREEYERGAFFTIKDKQGKQIGEATIAKVSKDEINLVWLSIDKSQRGNGYATAVMKAAAEFGEKAGVKKLTLEVPGRASDARHIYEKLGFKVTKEATSTRDVWGGLTEMEYNFETVKHVGHTELVVVALAAEDDVVRQYSSEKEPHLTLLYLGESDLTPADLAQITEYVEHAASQISSFGMEVERRGVLGPKNADVLFFHKKWAKQIAKFRDNLLQNELISKLYLSAEQFPEWIPHLTMGFPDKPAKPDKREYRRYSYVRFDRIALWTADSSGPTFELKGQDMEVAMAQEGSALAASIIANLEGDALQYGVPGMRWGKRKAKTPAPGSGKPPSADAVRAAKASLVAKKSGVKALSNEELQVLVTRLNLEQQLVRLTPVSRAKKTRSFLAKALVNVGNQQLNTTLNQAASAQVAGILAKTKK